MTTKTAKDNDYDKLVNIINCIKNGVDPDTGEIIGDNRFLLNSDIRKIFDLAEEYIINKTSVESDNEKKHEQTDDEQEVCEDVDDSITEWIRNVEKKYYDRLK